MSRPVRPIYVTGHKNPDTDAICAALGYAEYLRRTRIPEAQAACCGWCIHKWPGLSDASGSYLGDGSGSVFCDVVAQFTLKQNTLC